METSSFTVDLMNQKDLAKVIREAESNPGLSSKIEILMTLWLLAQSDVKGGDRIIKKIPHFYKAAESNVGSNINAKWDEWTDERDLILEDVKEHLAKGRDKKYRLGEKNHIKDVQKLHAAFGVKAAIVVAKFPDVSAVYASPRARKELLLHHLDPEAGKDTTRSGTKRVADEPADNLDGNVQDQTAKRVCQRTGTALEQESVIVPEAGSNPDIDFLTDGAELQDTIVKLTWSEIGEALGLEYTGQGAVSGCTDRQIDYKWSAISAIDVMGLKGELPASSTDDWLFYEVHPSNLDKLPFAILSYLIQRSMSWKAVRGQGRDMSACLKLALPRANRQDYGPFCRLSCVVPGADTSEHDQN